MSILRGIVHDPAPPHLRRGRFCFEGQNEDAGRRLLEFSCPSLTRGGSRLYWLVLDIDSLEVDCRCEDAAMRRFSLAGRYIYGTDDEKADGLQAQITRHPVGLCPHARKVQNWIKRRGFELGQEKAA